MEGFENHHVKKNGRSKNSSSRISRHGKKHGVHVYTTNSKVRFQTTRSRRLPNTRQLEPEFAVDTRKIRQIISDVLRRNLLEESYDAHHCNVLAMMTSEQIKSKVKLLHMPRYKIVCIVTVGSKSGQTFLQASRCLLNTKFDEIISESFENGSVFAVGVVYAFYQE